MAARLLPHQRRAASAFEARLHPTRSDGLGPLPRRHRDLKVLEIVISSLSWEDLPSPVHDVIEWRASEAGADYRRVRRGWCLGDKTFRKELLAQMKEQVGAEHYGEGRRETAEARAEAIVMEALLGRSWT